MSELAAFQDAFAKALRGEADLAAWGPPAALAAGLSVYRNTVAKARIDALRGTFPTVERLVGEAFFADCARLYGETSPPAEPSLLAYGEGFADFLAAFPPAADPAYLADVARFDWLWLRAHVASDAPLFTPHDAARLSPDALFAACLSLHPAARLAWSDTPAATIWSLNREPEPRRETVEVEWRGEGLLLTRPEGGVQSLILDAAGFAFLDACRSGRSLGEAAAAAFTANPDFDLAAAFSRFLPAGAFAALGALPDRDAPR